MVCRTQGVDAGIDMMARQMARSDYIIGGFVFPRSPGYDWAIQQELDTLGIHYSFNSSGARTEAGRKLIRDAVSAGKGAVIGMDNGSPTCNGPHAVVVTRFTDDIYGYIDPNNSELYYEGSMAWFNEHWIGLVVVIND